MALRAVSTYIQEVSKMIFYSLKYMNFFSDKPFDDWSTMHTVYENALCINN